MDVADVMTRVVKSCGPDQRLSEVAQLLWDGDIGALPVTDGAGRPLAMITDRDLCMAALTQGQALHALHVTNAMSRVLYTCHVQDRVTSAERTMRVHRVRRLPVVDDEGRLVGVLSLSDITRARLTLPASERAHNLLVDAAVTLSEISARPGHAQETAEAPKPRKRRESEPRTVRARDGEPTRAVARRAPRKEVVVDTSLVVPTP